MREVLVAVLTFLCLAGAGIGTMFLQRKLPRGHLEETTNATIRHVANLLAIISSLVLGLMMDSARSTFEAFDHNIHSFATELIIFDRTVRALGPEGDETHKRLAAYIRRVVSERSEIEADREAERLLDEVGRSLRAIRVSEDQLTTIWDDARHLYAEILRQRWIIIEQSEGTIPRPMMVLVIAWLVLIFATFGYRAPQNATVVIVLTTGAILMAGSIYLMLDMDTPSSGLIRASGEPLLRASAEIGQ
jgi:hypothetical protein